MTPWAADGPARGRRREPHGPGGTLLAGLRSGGGQRAGRMIRRRSAHGNRAMRATAPAWPPRPATPSLPALLSLDGQGPLSASQPPPKDHPFMGGPADDGEPAAGPGFRGADRGALARGRLLDPPESFVAAGQRVRPGHPRAVRRAQLPGLLHRVRGHADLGQAVGHGRSTRATRRSGSGSSAGS